VTSDLPAEHPGRCVLSHPSLQIAAAVKKHGVTQAKDLSIKARFHRRHLKQ
jgi:hypothetical protein